MPSSPRAAPLMIVFPSTPSKLAASTLVPTMTMLPDTVNCVPFHAIYCVPPLMSPQRHLKTPASRPDQQPVPTVNDVGAGLPIDQYGVV